MSCKSYLTLIDTVLLPFDPAALAASPSPAPPGAAATPPGVGAALGVPAQCSVQANALINGTTTVKAGDSNRQVRMCAIWSRWA